MKSSPKETGSPADVVVLGGPTDDGVGRKVVRMRSDRVETGELRPLQEGKPLTGDVVTLRPRENTPWLCDVDVAHAAPTLVPAADVASASSITTALGKGPAQVATKEYRHNWESIFGGNVNRALN